ncbi:hypothetical protein [Psittacid alphaherpesvirus 5]|uniref:Uncharacterized protein n=1 Tax=Psittacid alphaherpesvirus 5 TaxID=2972693 RepID=A0A5P9JTN5_9ALPH|nr:hypothetical protein QKU09_gp61 [Psittacid alphaherpesvirus 5]QFU14605.1 hypothetical protein [Psittacid alphaherpesvirus 5]
MEGGDVEEENASGDFLRPSNEREGGRPAPPPSASRQKVGGVLFLGGVFISPIPSIYLE